MTNAMEAPFLSTRTFYLFRIVNENIKMPRSLWLNKLCSHRSINTHFYFLDTHTTKLRRTFQDEITIDEIIRLEEPRKPNGV